MAKQTWKIYITDVRGNAKEGFDVNDLWAVGKITLDEPATKADIIKALRVDGWIKPRIHAMSIDVQVYDSLIEITDARDGKPAYQLQLVEELEVK